MSCKHQKDTFYAGNIPCEKCRVEKLELDLEQANEIKADMSMHIGMIAESLNVPFEPHQTFAERLLESAEKANKDIHNLAAALKQASKQSVLCEDTRNGYESLANQFLKDKQ